MKPQLKRNETLPHGLQWIAEGRLQEALQFMDQEPLTAELVHDARKAIKNLRAILRLARGALDAGARKQHNQVLRNLANRLSGPRDAVVTLTAFEKALRESLDEKGQTNASSPWVTQVRQSLSGQARASVPAESYRQALEEVRHLIGRVLPFENGARGDEWATVEAGLRKTYRQGRGLFYRLESAPDSPDEEWHELRKRVKDLGYQLALFKKIKRLKPLLSKLDKVGGALGDARDASLLKNYLSKVRDKYEFTSPEQQSYFRVLKHVERERKRLHLDGLKLLKGLYKPQPKKFTGSMAKRWSRA
jgi:CHAD domain-containing protein